MAHRQLQRKALALYIAGEFDTARAFDLSKMTLVVVGDLELVTPQLQAVPELKNIPFKTVTIP